MKLLHSDEHTRLFGTLTQNLVQNTWNWAKAAKTEDGNVYMMSSPFTCKDHILDSYMNGLSHGYTAKLWTKKEQDENSFLLFCTAPQYIALLKHIPLVLHPYEKKHRLVKTKITPVEEVPGGLHCVLIQGSQVWMRNATALSIYLSLVRLCGQTTNMTKFTLVIQQGENLYNNDRQYYANLLPPAKKLYMFYLNNPRIFMKKPPKGYGISTGTAGRPYVGHGNAGIYNMIHLMTNHMHRRRDGYMHRTDTDRLLSLSYMYPMVYKDTLKYFRQTEANFKAEREENVW